MPEPALIRFADGRPPFDGRGNLAFVLHRSADGRWLIRTEMGNEGVPDAPAASR